MLLCLGMIQYLHFSLLYRKGVVMLTLRMYAILGLFMVLSTCPPVLAEVYVYRDFRGQRHFTNRPEKIPLRYRSDAKRLPAKSRITRAIGPPPPDRNVTRRETIRTAV